jgi:IS30 family transposase
MAYSQLTQEQRYQIYELQQQGLSQGEIARQSGVHRTTVCREVRRNKGERGYRPHQAHEKAMERRARPRRPAKLDAAMREDIEEKLREDWSPEQAAGRRRREGKPTVGKTRIYRMIWEDQRVGGDLHTHLRRAHKKRRKRYGKPDRRGAIVGRVGIEHRPAVVETRSRLGDWEIDTVLGRQESRAIVTITERRSRFLVAAKLPDRKSPTLAGTVIALLEVHQAIVRTITADNGKEFADHEFIAAALEAEFYFARPYHSWERGTNENTNGLLRQYIPKKRSLKDLREAELQKTVARLNNRPRKVLDFATPLEALSDPLG